MLCTEKSYSKVKVIAFLFKEHLLFVFSFATGHRKNGGFMTLISGDLKLVFTIISDTLQQLYV